MRRIFLLVPLFVVLGSLPVLALFGGARRMASAPQDALAFESRQALAGGRLLLADHALPEGVAARRVQVSADALRDHQLYLGLAEPAGDVAYVHTTADGAVLVGNDEFARVGKSLELLQLPQGGLRMVVDDKPLDLDLTGRRLGWITASPEPPMTTMTSYPAVAINDGFMRTELDDGLWKVRYGQWSLQQHGGGMPTNDDEMHNYSFQRAVNPFTVLGSGHGLMTCGETPLINAHVEARMYLGRPRLEKIINQQDLPDGDLLVVIGEVTGDQVAFGWRGAAATFQLLTRRGEGEWTMRKSWNGPRPAVTNWVTVALELRGGTQAVALLDGKPVLEQALDSVVAGPMHLASGATPVEFDDVQAWSLPAPAAAMTPLYVQSRLFAGKKVKNHSDPEQFQEWARGSDTFRSLIPNRIAQQRSGTILSQQALFGDFSYESIPYDATAGVMPDGVYAFTFYRKDPAAPLDVKRVLPVSQVLLKREANKWRRVGATPTVINPTLELEVMALFSPGAAAPKPDADAASKTLPMNDAATLAAVTVPVAKLDRVWPADHGEFTLRMRRLAASGNRLELHVGDGWQAISEPIAEPLHVSVALLLGARESATPPVPEHHRFAAANLVQEFFEGAPSDWGWVDGAFRMDARWACQNQWNFMACASPAVPFASSKRTFYGNQEHEFYMSLRPNMPWDAGDETFKYDSTQDSGWQIFQAHEGWYSRRDLNFSFCTDGRDPLSGYSLIYAGYDNNKTVLMRRGKVVASTTDRLIPRDQSHHVIHWLWWNFRVCKYGDRIVVYYDGDELLSYTDPEPLDGGHIGFWTVRNGFTLSRVTSMAERLDRDPQALYVPNVPPMPDSPWQPLHRDSVSLTAATLATAGPAVSVAATSGSGFQAVRHTPATPVDLRATPVLELTLALEPAAKVNLFLDIGGEDYVIQLTAPLAEQRAWLSPRWETDEQFRLPVIDEAKVQARCLAKPLAESSGIAANGAPFTVRVDLNAALDGLGLQNAARDLRHLTIGNVSNQDYLLVGGGGNGAGPLYTVGTPHFLTATGTTP